MIFFITFCPVSFSCQMKMTYKNSVVVYICSMSNDCLEAVNFNLNNIYSHKFSDLM